MQPAGKPDVDAIFGIPPTVAIEQRTSRGGRKSTVATMTEIHHFLRLLYVKLGTQYCPDCNVAVEPQNTDQIAAARAQGEHIGLLAPLVTARKGYYTDLAKWAGARPLAPARRRSVHSRGAVAAPGSLQGTHHRAAGGGRGGRSGQRGRARAAVKSALENGQGVMSVVWPVNKLHEALDSDLQQQHFSVKRACPSCGISFPEPDPRLFSYNSKHGWCTGCFRHRPATQGFDEEQTGEETAWNAWYEGEAKVCTQCDGQRLNRVARAVRWRDKSIAELASLPVSDAHTFFTGLAGARPRGRDRPRHPHRDPRPPELHAGSRPELPGAGPRRTHAVRRRGAAHPAGRAAGLEPAGRAMCWTSPPSACTRATTASCWTLARLEGNGNTLVVVEHDDDTIRRASHIIDIGPGAGVRGGRVVAQGSAQDPIDAPESVTGRYLAHPLKHPLQGRRPVEADTPMIQIRGARLHNLRHVDAQIPVGRLSVVTGVSGSASPRWRAKCCWTT